MCLWRRSLSGPIPCRCDCAWAQIADHGGRKTNDNCRKEADLRRAPKIFAPRPNSGVRPATTVLHGGGIALLSASPGVPTPAGRAEIRIETNIQKTRTAELQKQEGVERLACATGGRAGPPYAASPEPVVKGPRVARSLDPLRTCFVRRRDVASYECGHSWGICEQRRREPSR